MFSLCLRGFSPACPSVLRHVDGVSLIGDSRLTVYV